MIRKCDVCGCEMKEGYCIFGGEGYYCSDECLTKKYSIREYIKLYGEGKGDSYWTTWEDEEDDYDD